MSTIGSPQRCPRCSQGAKNTRNLVVCIDGTSNEFGQNNTNVVKLFSDVDPRTTCPKQFTYYSSGIGTGPKSSSSLKRSARAVLNKLDMAVAWNLADSVKEAYAWLARMYEEGDQIYLFGFSRGAYQVRVLAAMIHEVGLIRVPTEKQIGTAYNHYEAIHSGGLEEVYVARKFRKTFSWDRLRVHFVGVWDTVSSVGVVRGNNLLRVSSSAARACHVRHALALDELRVKFMPEYFYRTSSQTEEESRREQVISPISERRESALSDNGIGLSGGKASDIKEVWFAGSHSDVGGTDRPGNSYHAGNVSLLWMRREAAENGLVLQPTDIVWSPNDIDLGVSDSMTLLWEIVEYLPVMHQVSFTRAGKNSRRWHRLQPRGIIPGQKVHASILSANGYTPHASLGNALDTSEQGDTIWEMDVFDDSTASQDLEAYLDGREGIGPIYFDKLLFMLRSKEGRQCIRNVPDWQRRFLNLIHNPERAALARLITIVAYYEASCDSEVHPKSAALPHDELPQETFDDAKQSLREILEREDRDDLRVVTLLRPLLNHQVLRERILTPEALETVVGIFDKIIRNTTRDYFCETMEGLTCLLNCEDARARMFIISKLGENAPGSNTSRLSLILRDRSKKSTTYGLHRDPTILESRLLTAALRVVMTLAQIEEGKSVCSDVKPRLRELAQVHKGEVGLLSVNILLALYHAGDQGLLNIHHATVQANLAEALLRLSTDGQSVDGLGRRAVLGQNVFQQLFGFGATELKETQKKFISELKVVVAKASARRRMAAVLTLLKLCESEVIRAYLRDIHLPELFIHQLRHKDSALLAAHALVTCLKYSDMESILTDERLSQNIVGMLELNYFDDAVGQKDGFQIFEDLMQHDGLREKIKEPVTKVLDTKLAKGDSKETQASLDCLKIFQSHDGGRAWTEKLVGQSLEYLQRPSWKAQKAGVLILSALAQTEHGVAVIDTKILEIIEMILPAEYLTNRSSIASTSQTQPTATPQESADTAQPKSPDARSPSWMMGPACALRILAQNETLRKKMRNTLHYGRLKYLFLARRLIDEKVDTSPWLVNTPNRADIMNMLDKMIRAVDGKQSEEGLLSIGDAALPHVKHWNRLVGLFRDGTATIVAIPPALLGIVLATPVAAPVYLGFQATAFCKKSIVRFRSRRIFDMMMHGDGDVPHGTADVPSGHGEGVEDVPDTHDMDVIRSEGVEAAVAKEVGTSGEQSTQRASE